MNQSHTVAMTILTVFLVIILPVLMGLLINWIYKKIESKKSQQSLTDVPQLMNEVTKTFMIRDERFNANALERSYIDVPLLLGEFKHPESNTFNEVIGTALMTQQPNPDELKINLNIVDLVPALDTLEPAIAGRILDMSEDGQINKFELVAVSLVPQGMSKLKAI